MKRFIILLMQDENSEIWKEYTGATFLEEICLCDELGNLVHFASLDEADNYRESAAIDGKIIEIPFY